jgi:hypothetical protein
MTVNCMMTEEHSWHFAVSLVLIRSEKMFFRGLLKMIVHFPSEYPTREKALCVVRWAKLD